MPVEAQSIDRSKLGVTPRAKEEDPGAMAFACCDFGCGKQTAYFQEELSREEATHNKTVSLLSARVKELEEMRGTLSSTQTQQVVDQKNLSQAKQELNTATASLEEQTVTLKAVVAEKDVLTDEILTERAEMKKAAELIIGLEKELELERALLGDSQKAKAQARWNLGANKEKAEAMSRKLKFQGGLRQQIVAKTVEERESLVEELVRERKEKEELARQRLETVEALKISLNAQIDAVLGSLHSEMGDAEVAAAPKEAVEITKIALENKKAGASPGSKAKPAVPKKSGSILGAIGGLFGMNSETSAEAPMDEEEASEAAISEAVEAMVSSAVAAAAAEASVPSKINSEEV